MSLARKTLFVTGASRGLGAALARGLAARGARLLLVGRHAVPLEQVAKATKAQALVADVGRPEAALAIAAAAVTTEKAKTCDILSAKGIRHRLTLDLLPVADRRKRGEKLVDFGEDDIITAVAVL